MRIRWVAVPVSFALLLAFILFVPVVRSSGGESVCGTDGCIHGIVQYESMSYAYGGWGAFFQTEVNWYVVDGWVCSCPAVTSVPCCVPPFSWIVWPVVDSLVVGSVFSAFLVTRRTPK